MVTHLRYPHEQYLSECTFETARSGGKGGQHVNKTESKVTLVFDLDTTPLFDESEKLRIAKKLSSHFFDGIIRVSSEESRSQFQNKAKAIQRFFELLEKALIVPKKRIPTRVSRAKKEKRLKAKRIESEKKQGRRRPDID